MPFRHSVELNKAMTENEIELAELFEDLETLGLREPILMIADGRTSSGPQTTKASFTALQQRC